MAVKRKPLLIGGERIRAGETRDIRVKISETYTGEPIELPVRISRAKKAGPRVFLTAAIHGDEINGTGIIREIAFGSPPPLIRGTLISVPVVNTFGFETHNRYLPDRRDLNRCFPGLAAGSLASRLAHLLFRDIVQQSDYGIDLHTAAIHRTNFPNVRADLSNPEAARIARAFGCELVVRGKGPDGSLRREACRAGCATILLEGGEVAKIEPGVLATGVQGVRNVLIELGMIKGEPARPLYQTTVRRTTWVRAEVGGLLRFHVRPGDLVMGGQPIASNESVFGEARTVLIAPVDGIVLGMTTHPAVKPGEPVCHIAVPSKSVRTIRRALSASNVESLYHRVRAELETNMLVSKHGAKHG